MLKFTLICFGLDYLRKGVAFLSAIHVETNEKIKTKNREVNANKQ